MTLKQALKNWHHTRTTINDRNIELGELSKDQDTLLQQLNKLKDIIIAKQKERNDLVEILKAEQTVIYNLLGNKPILYKDCYIEPCSDRTLRIKIVEVIE
jgi:hypothetical protein